MVSCIKRKRKKERKKDGVWYCETRQSMCRHSQSLVFLYCRTSSGPPIPKIPPSDPMNILSAVVDVDDEQVDRCCFCLIAAAGG
jgi:hypothetical protein